MNPETLNEIPQETLINLCKELIAKIQTHNYNNPDVFALYGYCTLLLKFTSKIEFKEINPYRLNIFFHHYDKELDIAISSIGTEREKEFKFLSLLSSELFELKEELSKL